MNSFTKIRPRLVDDTSGVFSRSRRWIPLNFASRARARPAPGPLARTGPPGAAQLIDLQARTTWATPHTRQRQRPWQRPWQRIAGRRVPRCPSHSSRGGLPQRWTQQSRTLPPLSARRGRESQRWGSSQILSCFRTAGNYCETLPASGRAPRVVAAGSALSQKHYASRLWPSGLSRVAPRQSSTPAIKLARWRAKSLGHF